MSGAEDNKSSHDQLSSQVFLDLVDSVIADVASECHRIARLGLDRDLEVVEEELRLSVEARAKVADPSNNLETNTKYVVDIFGQTHPPVASEVFNCMNCGRQIVAGRFAPHLEKCMGKLKKSTDFRTLAKANPATLHCGSCPGFSPSIRPTTPQSSGHDRPVRRKSKTSFDCLISQNKQRKNREDGNRDFPGK